MLGLYALAFVAWASAASAVPAAPTQTEPVAELRRAGPAAEAARDWFAGLDRLLDESEALARGLADSARAPRARDARAAGQALDGLTSLYLRLTGDEAGAAAARASLAALGRLVDGLPADAPLPAPAVAAVYPLERGSLHHWLELMRQEALKAPGPKGAFPPNALLSAGAGSERRELPFLSLEPPGGHGAAALVGASRFPFAGGGGEQAAPGPAVRALARAARAPSAPTEWTFVAGRRRLWARRGSAELFADLGADAGGSLLRARYREPGRTALEQARFYFLTRALYELGLAAGVANGELTATLGGEGRGLDPWSRAELVVTALSALDAAAALPARLADYLAGSVSQEENARRLDELARVFAAEGRLPEGGSLRAELERYRVDNAARERLRGEMDRSLLRLGLEPFPPELGVGQRTIDLYYNAPLEAGAARGELELGKDTPRGDPAIPRGATRGENDRATPRGTKGYDPLRALAGAKTGAPVPAGYFARASPLGLVGGRWAQRAQWRLDEDRWLVLYGLRSAATGEVEAALAFSATRAGPAPLAPADALMALAEAGVEPGPDARAKDLSADGAPRPQEGRLFARVLQPGGILTARVTYDPQKALLGDRIFVTPYLTPGDARALRRCRALVTTAGGPQAAILAALARAPALDLPQGAWSRSAGLQLAVPVLGKPSRAAGVELRRVEKLRIVALREGDALRLDARAGAVEPLDPERQEALVRLEEALTAYDRSGDVEALALWTSGQLLGKGRDAAAKKVFADALLVELERRTRTGLSPEHLNRIKRIVEQSL